MGTQTSTIPYVRGALEDSIVSLDLRFVDDSDEKVGVSIGEPPGGFKREHVLIAEVPEQGSDQKWRNLGFRTREENYQIDVIVSVTLPGKTCRQASEEAYRLLAAIETELRRSNETVTLGQASRGVRNVEVAAPADVLMMGEEGAHCAVKWSLRVNSDLRVTA